MSMRTIQIELPLDRVEFFCVKWKIAELALFGSVLREDFRPESDLDVLVSFKAGTAWSLLDHVVMQEELSDLLKRKVDLVSRRAVEASDNLVRRQAILDSTETVYVAR